MTLMIFNRTISILLFIQSCTRAVRYAMCIVAERDNALHDFVVDHTLK